MAETDSNKTDQVVDQFKNLELWRRNMAELYRVAEFQFGTLEMLRGQRIGDAEGEIVVSHVYEVIEQLYSIAGKQLCIVGNLQRYGQVVDLAVFPNRGLATDPLPDWE